MKFMIFAHKRYAGIRYMCVHVTWNNSQDILEKSWYSRIIESKHISTYQRSMKYDIPFRTYRIVRAQSHCLSGNPFRIKLHKMPIIIEQFPDQRVLRTFFPYTKRKYNNREQTFSKSHTFERITARSVLTYLVYGIFDSNSFCENKISKL